MKTIKLTKDEMAREVLHILAMEGMELTEVEAATFTKDVENGTCEEGIARILEKCMVDSSVYV